MHWFEGHYWGMHIIWWVIWVIFIIWIFATPWDIPGQRTIKETPLDLLKKRYAKGEISKEEYEDIKKTLQK
ncbi:putative membrane protein [Catalinimonas alkaloidigena]|jgi:putative membrane protein|uniref:SHOCT domain-containing protein n=1 Tax=Catalinimonas alkaloidigena TaxID=1075417 RepID=UPI0024072E24|nr:SHOCT domain-containing protein [Catalinimonas alkaloidigena]MDF9799164.1 putative membrane protein [Catalinimonas alkaloidigena]